MTNNEFLKVPVIRIEQPLGVFYVAAINASELLKVCYTNRLRAEPTSGGYSLDGTQRDRKKSRLVDIGKYISQDDVAFPNSIILAANYRQQDGTTEQDSALRWSVEFENDTGCGILTIPTDTKLATIVDGQHRLGGFLEAERSRKEMPLLCSIFLDLPRQYQAYLFATINSTQKPVDRSQTYELYGYNLDEEPEEQWSPDKLSVFFSRKLNTERESPFFQRVLVSAESEHFTTRADARRENRWIVSMAVVVDGISALISSNPKEDARILATNKSERSRSDLIENRSRNDSSPLRELYLQSLDPVVYSAVYNFFTSVFGAVKIPENEANSFLTKTVGIQALFKVLKRVSEDAVVAKDFRIEYFEELLKPLSEIDFSNEVFKQASGQGMTLIRDAIFMQIGYVDDVKDNRKAEIVQTLSNAKFEAE